MNVVFFTIFLHFVAVLQSQSRIIVVELEPEPPQNSHRECQNLLKFVLYFNNIIKLKNGINKCNDIETNRKNKAK
jgi:hypothetical protein